MQNPRETGSGSRRYNSYSEKTLQKALTAINEGKISINKASVKYNIAKGTLVNKLHGKHLNKFGGPPIFTQDEEKLLLEYILTIKEWGYPFSIKDLRFLGKFYLDTIGKKPPKYGPHNMPGIEWARRFIMRYKDDLNCQNSRNIGKTKREKISFSLTEFFSKWQECLLDECSEASPSTVFGFSLVLLCHDPVASKCFTKRVKKYEQCMSNSDAAVMLCGSASGQMIPPFVVYKAEHLTESWTKSGPKNTTYNISPFGCFDPGLFLEWFQKLFIPQVEKLNDRIVLIGDYSSSLFSPEVLELAKENNIVFTCVPGNITHLCQPLEYSFHSRLEHHWRSLLTEWKEMNGPLPIDRKFFPILLNQLLTVACNVSSDGSVVHSKDLVDGFKECGLLPFNSLAVIDKVLNVLEFRRSGTSDLRRTLSERESVDISEDMNFGLEESDESENEKIFVTIVCQEEMDSERILEVSDHSKTKSKQENVEASQETIRSFEEAVKPVDESFVTVLYQQETSDGSNKSDRKEAVDFKPQSEPIIVRLLT